MSIFKYYRENINRELGKQMVWVSSKNGSEFYNTINPDQYLQTCENTLKEIISDKTKVNHDIRTNNKDIKGVNNINVSINGGLLCITSGSENETYTTKLTPTKFGFTSEPNHNLHSFWIYDGNTLNDFNYYF